MTLVPQTPEYTEFVVGRGHPSLPDVDSRAWLILHDQYGGLKAVASTALTNKSGGSLSAGDVVVADQANDSGVVTTTVRGDGRPVLVVVKGPNNEGDPVLTNEAGYLAQLGVATVNVQGNVTRGNFLRTSTTVKRAEDAGAARVVGAFAMALTGFFGGGAGTVVAMLFGNNTPDHQVDFNYIFNGDFEIWGAGVSATPTGWSLNGAGATVAKTTAGGQFKIGTAGVALTRVGADCNLAQEITAHGYSSAPTKDFWQGKEVSFGCWVRATVANRARIRVNDGVTETYSGFHGGGGSLEFLTAPHTMSLNATALTVTLHIETGDTAAQFDGAVLVIGRNVKDFQPSGWRGRKALIPATTGPTNVGAGQTVYMNSGGFSGTEVQFTWRVPFASYVLRRLSVRSSATPGGTETFIYTVRKDAADTLLTVTVPGGAASGLNTADEVAFIQSNDVSIKLVTSAGAAAAFHNVWVEVEEIP